MKVEGLARLKAALFKLKMRAKADASVKVVVGFSQRYAIYVHEDLTANHKVGQAKYLETPARRLKSELGKLVATTYAKTHSISKSLLVAGLRLQREAQLLVPVDTSALKASAFTALEQDYPAAAQEAFTRSERIRERGMIKKAVVAKRKAKRLKRKKK